MPVVFRSQGYRGWFYEADLKEPPHVHVGKDGKEAKFWMSPIRLARAGRFRANELREIERILHEFQGDILAVWEREKSKHDNG
jgi:hypothetical protein